MRGSTVVKKLEDEKDLKELENAEPMMSSQQDEISIYEIESVEKIEKYLECDKCMRKILQVKSSLAHCHFCGQHTRASKCKKDVCVKVEVMDGEERLELMAFSSAFESMVPGIADLDENDIAEKVFSEKNVHIINRMTQMLWAGRLH